MRSRLVVIQSQIRMSLIPGMIIMTCFLQEQTSRQKNPGRRSQNPSSPPERYRRMSKQVPSH